MISHIRFVTVLYYINLHSSDLYIGNRQYIPLQYK